MATFTRKHFVQTAETLALITDETARNIQVQLFVDMFRKSNPRFDVAKFVTYVYDTAEKKKAAA